MISIVVVILVLVFAKLQGGSGAGSFDRGLADVMRGKQNRDPCTGRNGDRHTPDRMTG